MNQTMIVLIHKKEFPQNFYQFRPISLCNVIYKFISKIIARRLRLIMVKIILPNQVSFVPERHITDNILIVQEVLHSMHICKGNLG